MQTRGIRAAKPVKNLPALAGGEVKIAWRPGLDNFYIPARYPSSHPEGPPFEHFGSLESNAALDHARAIIEFVRDEMA